jgi:hypothetical protein
MSKTPIFIHSLFRAGSTYLFNVFRRSTAGYWCYQEPLHEMAVFARDEPSQLLKGFGEKEMRLNRHPHMDIPYFQELHDTWPAWKDSLSASAIYDTYFAPQNADIGISFWLALIDAAQGRPVFQECRTSGRIGAIKGQLGGHHIYLWRNPWDQWWSYKVTAYFDVANQLILNASYSPPAVLALRAALGFEGYAGDDLGDAFAYFSAKPLSSEESYLIFYLLWCLGLQAGVKHAHLMLNIDRLSDSPAYRVDMQTQLAEDGIGGVDFSDCHVPQGRYLEQDQTFFNALEDKVHAWLKESSWSQEELDHIKALRQQFEPASWAKPVETLEPQDMAEQATRARALVRRYETNLAEASRENALTRTKAEARANQAETRASELEDQANQAEARASELEARANQAETRASELEARANQAETRASELEARANQAEARGRELEARVTQAETMLSAIYTSRSWKLTQPLRWLSVTLQEKCPVCASLSRRITRLFRVREMGGRLIGKRLRETRASIFLGRRFGSAIRFLLKRPVLKARAKKFLVRYPALAARARKLVGWAINGDFIPKANIIDRPVYENSSLLELLNRYRFERNLEKSNQSFVGRESILSTCVLLENGGGSQIFLDLEKQIELSLEAMSFVASNECRKCKMK